MSEPRFRSGLAVVLLVCLATRLAFVFGFGRYPAMIPLDGYAKIAESVLAGRGFAPIAPFSQNELRCPSYPLLLVAVWLVVPPKLPEVPLDSA
jgi:hypothetical protein